MTQREKGSRADGARNANRTGKARTATMAGTATTSGTTIDAETAERAKHWLRQMLLIRRFEEKAAEMYQRAKIGGYCHLNLGEEATCVGVAAGMQPTDYLFTNYREHGYALARGIEPERVMAELFGREGGVARGRGGSMHLFDADKRLMGGYAIVGGQLPLATGAGLAIVRKGEHDVVVCQIGDATTNIGAFHESLNLAALWKLPVVYVIVNNGYGMGTSVEAGSSVAALHEKACAYGIPGVEVNGNDVLTVRDAVREAVERARADHTPTLMNVESYRLRGHSVVDPDRYRSEDYLKKIRAEDPVVRLAERLKQDGALDDDGLEQIEDDVDRQIQAAVEFADESPEPNPQNLFEFSYATPVPNQPKALPGQPPWL
jgi:pyruvate dehydrogenase E1 component alpha subunit